MTRTMVALLVAGTILGAAVALVALVVMSASDGEVGEVGEVDPAQVAAAEAYLAEIRPIATDGGQVVQEVLKPAITRLEDADGDHDQQAEAAGGWVASMTSVRERWAEVEPPPKVADSHELFLDALDRYVAAAERLARATTDDEQREALVDEAIELGTEGDQLYDRAAVLVQELLVAAGQDPVAWLPQP